MPAWLTRPPGAVIDDEIGTVDITARRVEHPYSVRSCLPRLAALAAVLVIGLVSILYLTSDPSPVGHFRSVEGEARYKRSYARAMETLPSQYSRQSPDCGQSQQEAPYAGDCLVQ